jgi:hypothetical protein
MSEIIITPKSGFVLPMDEDVKAILGRPNFSNVSVFEALRFSGVDIPRRYEDEQAACFHWLLNLYFTHGAEWLYYANKFIREQLEIQKQKESHE